MNTTVAELLWEKFRTNKDSKSFKALFNTYYGPLCRYAFVLLKDNMDAEEVVLDFFLYLWENRHRIQINVSVDSYFFKSVRNRCLNILRSSCPNISLDDTMLLALSPNLSKIDMEDLSEIIREAVISLPPRCREAYIKSRTAGLSNLEIAKDMGVTEKTVEAHITKALKFLRIAVKKFYIFIL